MSVQWFKQLPTAEQRTRSVICGHPVRVRSSMYDAVTEIPCQICGREQAVHDNVARDCVPTPSLGWVGSEKTKTKILSASKLHADRVTSLEQLCAKVTFDNAPSIDLHSRYLKLENSISAHLTTKFIVWRASPTGCTVHSGTIHIPKGSTLLLDGSGAHFNKITFSGGSVVCTGADYSGTFSSCTFDRCPLYVTHGAAVSLSCCNLTHGVPTLVASGPGTAVTLRRCSIQTVITGIIVEERATLRAAALRLRGATGHMYMFINDAGSRAAFTDSLFAGPRGRRSHSFGAFMHGGHLSLLRCGLVSIRMAVYALDASVVQMRGGYIEDCGWGVIVGGGGHALVRDVEMSLWEGPDETGSYPVATAFGKRLAPEGASGQVERCTLRGSHAQGMHVSYGGKGAIRLCRIACVAGSASVEGPRSRVTVSHSDLRDSSECLKVASAGCSMRVDRCAVQGVGGACVVTGGSFTAVDSTLRGSSNVLNGVVAAAQGATVALLRCAVLGTGVGVRVVNSRARVVRTRVADMVSHMLGRAATADGVQICCGSGYACVGGELRVVGGAVENCIVGAMVSGDQFGRRAVLEMRGVRVKSYIVGVRGYEQSELELRDCEFEAGSCESLDLEVIEQVGPGPGRETAVAVWNGLRADVEGCRFVGNWGDITAKTLRTRVANCTFERSKGVARTGSCIRAEGEMLIERCCFTDVERAVTCEGGSCVVRKCELGPGVREVGVVAVEDGEVRLVGSTVQQGLRAFALLGQAALEVEDCVVAQMEYGFVMEGVDCAATARRVRMRGVQNRVCSDSYAGANPNVRLIDCSFES